MISDVPTPFLRPLSFHNWVLVSPACHLQRSGKGWDNVVKMDMFEKRLLEQINKLGVAATFSTGARIVSLETLASLARTVLAPHRPACVNYTKRFGVAEVAMASPSNQETMSTAGSKMCQSCGIVVEPKVVAFCRINSQRFGKRLLCRTCQAIAVTT